MPHKALKQSKPEFDPEVIQQKISLIEKGLPIDIEEKELQTLEETLRGARSFYLDILDILNKNKEGNDSVRQHIVEESANLVGIEMALRKVDIFREKHWTHIKNSGNK